MSKLLVQQSDIPNHKISTVFKLSRLHQWFSNIHTQDMLVYHLNYTQHPLHRIFQKTRSQNYLPSNQQILKYEQQTSFKIRILLLKTTFTSKISHTKFFHIIEF